MYVCMYVCKYVYMYLCTYVFILYRTAHILHVPNTSDHTTVYRVECDLEFISGSPTVTITGNTLYSVLLPSLLQVVL